MNKKIKLSLIAGLAAFSVSASVVAAVAWFKSSVSFTSGNISGKTAGAYFHSGDGSEDNPFTILSPRNFYNLAWLQDMGMFNQQEIDDEGNPVVDESGNPVIKQYYFKLHDNLKNTGLNMGGWTIPPIGTQQYPFLGQFIGNDVVVSNFTISNDFDDYGNNHPNTIDDFSNDGVKQPEIVGIFGVVGEISGSGTYTYDSQINTVSNFSVNNFTVKSNTSKVLIGLTAGYVNGEVNNVAINNGSINVAQSSTAALDATNLTKNLSDYTAIGYCTDEYKTSVSSSTDQVYGTDVVNTDIVVDETGDDGIAAGGTIKMTDIYNRLVSINNASSRTSQVVRRTITTNPSGSTSTTNDYTATNAFRNYHSTNYETGNYSIAYWNDTSYMCMAGGIWENNYTDRYYSHEGIPITDGSNYLSYSGGLVNRNSLSSASLWTFTTGTNKTISTTYNGTTYYLYNNNGTLAARTTSYNSWTIVAGDDKLDIYNGTYHVNCVNGTWLLTDTNTSYLTDGVNYLACAYSSGTTGTLSNTTTASSAASWTFSTYNGTGTISCVVRRNNGNTYTYYLYNNNGTLAASTTSYNWHISTSGNVLTISDTSDRYYLNCENKTWSLYDTNVVLEAYYLIHDSSRTYFLTNSGSWSCSTGTSATDSTAKWYYNSGSNYFYPNGHTNYKLGCDTSSSNYYLQAYSDSDYNYMIEGFTAGSTTTGQLKCSDGRTYDYYVYLNGKSFAAQRYSRGTTVTDSSYQITIEYVDPSSQGFTSSLVNPVFSVVINEEDSTTQDGPDTYRDDSKTYEGMKFTNDNTSYFPLNVKKDGTQSSGNFTEYYSPSDNNTGYIVSGSTYTNSFSDSDCSDATNIRVSRYNISNISNSYASGNYKTSGGTYNIYTLNSSYDFVKASDTLYENYSETLAKLKNDVLSKSSSYVYGLHFMDAQISKDALVTAKYVKLNTSKTNYTDYQLPVNSIDFNLIEKGNIKLFGGMYYNNPNNDAFMSLHQVKRNKTTHIIEDIKEIEEVYSDGIESHSYVYKFTDGKYSKAFQMNLSGANVEFDGTTTYAESLEETSLPTSYIDPSDNKNKTCTYTAVFNTQRMTNHWYHSENSHTKGAIVNNIMTYSGSTTIDSTTVNTNKSILYFEVPMNEGEFCLGSVSGGTGGYLFYLDIGANAKKISRTKFTEHFVMLDMPCDFPNGVAFKEATVGSTISVSNGESAFAKILPSFNSTVKFEASGTGVYVSQGYDDDYIIGAYKNASATFKSGAPPGTADIDIVVVPIKTEIRRVEYYDFDVASRGLTQTIVTNTVVSINDVVQSAVTVIQQYLNGKTGTLQYDSSDEDLDDTTGIKFYNDSGKAINIAGLSVPASGTNTEILIVVIDYDFNGSGFEGKDFELTAEKAAADAYYTGTGYVVNYNVGENGTMTITYEIKTGLPTAYSSITVTVSDHYVVTIDGAEIKP